MQIVSQIQVYITHCLPFVYFQVGERKSRWEEHHSPASNPWLASAADEGRETISQNGHWVSWWWHRCVPPYLGNQRNALSPPGCQHATARWSQEVRWQTEREKDDCYSDTCVQWDLLLSAWWDRCYFKCDWFIFSLSCILSSPDCWKGFLLGTIFSVLPMYSKCRWEPRS